MKAQQAGLFSALLASACCVGPLLLAAVGMGSSSALFGRYHWLFLIAGLGVLVWAWTRYLREKTVCECEHRPMEGRKAGLFTLLAATAIVLGFAVLNISRSFVAAPPAAVALESRPAPTEGLSRVTIPVQGMTCATCEISVSAALNRVPGVKSAQVSAQSQSATIDYDPAQAGVEQLVTAINSTGYRAVVSAR